MPISYWRQHAPLVTAIAFVLGLLLIAGLLPKRAELQSPEPNQQQERPHKAQDRADPKSQPSTAKQGIPDDKPAAEKSGTYRHYDYRQLAHGLWDVVGKDIKWTDAAVAIFTGLLTLIASLQIRYNRINQRAYLSVEAQGLRRRKNDDLWIAHVGIRNAGLLPARDVKWKISIEPFGTDNDWKGFLYVHPYRGNHVIPTGTTMRRGSEPFSVGTIGDLQERWMYVWGEVTYTDGFGKERFTKFCHRYNNQAIVPDGKGRHWIPPEDARHHDHGNEAT